MTKFKIFSFEMWKCNSFRQFWWEKTIGHWHRWLMIVILRSNQCSIGCFFNKTKQKKWKSIQTVVIIIVVTYGLIEDGEKKIKFFKLNFVLLSLLYSRIKFFAQNLFEHKTLFENNQYSYRTGKKNGKQFDHLGIWISNLYE